MKNNIIEVQNVQINVINLNEKDYICISDIAKAKSDKSRAADVIRNWLRNRSTLDFLTQVKNPYVFKVNGRLVKLCFSDNGLTADDCLTKVLENLYR